VAVAKVIADKKAKDVAAAKAKEVAVAKAKEISAAKVTSTNNSTSNKNNNTSGTSNNTTSNTTNNNSIKYTIVGGKSIPASHIWRSYTEDGVTSYYDTNTGEHWNSVGNTWTDADLADW